MQSVIPRPEIAALLTQHFVAVASDCDDPEPEVEELAMKLEDAMMLPFVLLCDRTGQFLDGSSGAQSPAGFHALLAGVVERHPPG